MADKILTIKQIQDASTNTDVLNEVVESNVDETINSDANGNTKTTLKGLGNQIKDYFGYFTGFAEYTEGGTNYIAFQVLQDVSGDKSWYVATKSFSSSTLSNDLTLGNLILWQGLTQTTGVIRVSSVADLEGLSGVDGWQISVGRYHADFKNGQLKYEWGNGRHNGGTFIDPSRPFPSDWSDDTQVDSWFEDSGEDVDGWMLLNSDQGVIRAEWFGALGNVDMRDIASGFDSTKSFKASERTCLTEIPKSSTPGDDETYWESSLRWGKGLFKITEPLIKDTITSVTESVTFKGVGRMSRLLWSSSKVVANNREQDGLFELDLTRYGHFSDFSVLVDYDKPGHGFDMGAASKLTVENVTGYFTAGDLPSHPNNSELKIVRLEDIIYGFRYNKQTGNSILNTFDNVRLGDAASLNNGIFTDGKQGVIGWGVDESFIPEGQILTINSTKWVKCTAESMLAGTRFVKTIGLDCEIDLLAEGMSNGYTIFPALLGTPSPTATLSGNTLTSDDTIPSYVHAGQFVSITSQSKFDGQARMITDVNGDVLTVDGDFDFDESDVTFSVVSTPTMLLTGIQSSVIKGYVEAAVTSSPSFNLNLFDLFLKSCSGNTVKGYYGAFCATFNSPKNEFRGLYNGLYFSGYNDLDGGYNDVSGVTTNSSTWSKSGVRSSKNMLTNNVGAVLNGTNGKLVGRLPAAATPPDFSFDSTMGVSITATDTQIPIYLTAGWVSGGDPLVGLFEIDGEAWDTSNKISAAFKATAIVDAEGDVTIGKQASTASSINFTSGSTYIQIENTGGDKTLKYTVRRMSANTQVFGI